MKIPFNIFKARRSIYVCIYKIGIRRMNFVSSYKVINQDAV